MTELEKEIELAILDAWQSTLSSEGLSKAAAQVALKWIEKAFRAGENYEYGSQFDRIPNPRPDLSNWLKENGLTEQEPFTAPELSGNGETTTTFSEPPNRE